MSNICIRTDGNIELKMEFLLSENDLQRVTINLCVIIFTPTYPWLLLQSIHIVLCSSIGKLGIGISFLKECLH